MLSTKYKFTVFLILLAFFILSLGAASSNSNSKKEISVKKIVTNSVDAPTRIVGDTGKRIIQCLHEEEQDYLTRKVYSPEQTVTAELVGQLITYETFPIKQDVVEKICQTKLGARGVEFLRYLLTEKEAILVDKQENGRSFFSEIVESGPDIFMRYLTTLQSMAPSHDCLSKRVPFLKDYLRQFKDIEGEYNSLQQLTETQKITKLFDGLKNYPKLIKRCQDEIESQIKAKAKAKAMEESESQNQNRSPSLK